MAEAQSFAGLGTDVAGYGTVTSPADLKFPRDHGAHPEFRIEWWYLTANLEDADGRDYGIQWTLFRQATKPASHGDGWLSNQIWMGHAALTTEGRHLVAEKFARGGIGQADVETEPFNAWIDDWSLTSADDGIGDLRVIGKGANFDYDLTLQTNVDPVAQGDDGFSVKSTSGQASYYYSQPFYAAEGRLTVEGREVAVTGEAWLDREWSSQPLGPDQEGWDWFSLHLESGDKVMLFRLRGAGTAPYYSGTWIAANGTPTPLRPDQIVMTPRAEVVVAERHVPMAWRLEVPDFGLAVDTEALNAQSWMDTVFPYWEGPIAINGSHAGRGYLEMTGYE